jgi:phenylalanyl-tRNA synthetase beta chain
MKISLNTIKQYTDIDLSVDELVAKINQQLGGVEGGAKGVTDLGKRYEGAIIAKVVECNDHPDADRLHVCKIDDGGVVEHVERDEGGLVKVVCGAPNVRADMFVVWLPPKAIVPASYDEAEPFTLEARPLRGVVSNGMLASAKELGIGDSHEGLLEIDPTEWKPIDVEIKPGTSFAKAYGLDDTLIEIENKMFTHRPDLFGQLGVAREIAGIQHKKFTSPEWYLNTPEFTSASGLELTVSNEATDQVPRFMAVALKDVDVKPSPLWLQAELVRLGGKPINNIVDVTNYIMLLTAQPVHAYDYDKLRGHTLISRMAGKGETVKLLNGKTYQLDESDIVIADGEGPVGLAGIMGGGESEVSSDTKNIVLEVATFDMYAVRKSSMRHGVFTDALTRFNKGQSPLQNDRVLSLLMQSIKDVAGGEQASDVADAHNVSATAPVAVTKEFVNERLGSSLDQSEIKSLLTDVELNVDDELNVTPAFWRTDLELPEDIVEEVGRLYGYDKLPRELPKRSTKPAPKNTARELSKTIRNVLSRAGANEVLTYSFVHEQVLRKAGQDPTEAYRISNALSPDLQYYRLSLTPSLLDKIHGNVKAGHSEFAIFEIGKGHSKRAKLDEAEGLPPEMRRIALVYAAKKNKEGSPYYQAKILLDFLATKLGLTLDYKPLPEESTLSFARPFEPKRSARIIDATSGHAVGIIGEYRAAVKRSFKLPEYSAGFELIPEGLEMALTTKASGYRPLSKYPSTSRDICFKVANEVMYQQIHESVRMGLADAGVDTLITPVDIYQGQGDSTKNITIHVSLTPRDRTLQGDEASAIIDKMVATVVTDLHAEVV